MKKYYGGRPADAIILCCSFAAVDARFVGALDDNREERKIWQFGTIALYCWTVEQGSSGCKNDGSCGKHGAVNH
ncbi:MAG TPA: hypothetical protein PK843_15295 [bacterium]|nr:hypothetical protein [bacterium]